MPHVVFIRAANVGGKNVFRPAQLATALAHLGVVNVGAAGTFVVREKAGATEIRREIRAKLSFETAIAVLPAKQLVELVRSQPFRGVKFSKQLRGWAAPLCGRAKMQPALPITVPEGTEWSVRFDRLEGPFALGLWHWRPRFVFASQVVENAIGVPATTRWWETFERVAAVIER